MIGGRRARLGCRGTTALEFGLVAPVLFTLLFGGFEAARYFWTLQALQLAGDQTARCVAIGGAACSAPSTYAVNVAKTFGAAIVPGNVAVDTVALTATSCPLPLGNTATRVRLAMSFSSPFQPLLPFLAHGFTTVSCYPLTGK